MGTIITSGIGSGLDIGGLVTQLVAAEGQADSFRLDVDEAGFQAELSALGSFRSALVTFRSALEALKDIDSFRGRQVALSGEDFLAAVPGTDAAPGTYEIEVERLASAHRLASAEYLSGDAEVGTGSLTINVGAAGFALTIDESNNTLAAIRDAINNAENNPGVSATIVNGVTGSRLVLNANEPGTINNLVITASGGDGGLDDLVFDPINGTTNLTELAPAADSRILIDGLAAEGSSNTISGAIDGLDIDLLSVNTPGETTAVTVGFDPDGAREAVTQLVDSYNALVDAIGSLTAFDADTQVAGPLLGDASVRNVTFQLRRELNEPIGIAGNPFSGLFEVGISTDLDGKLTIDEEALTAALDSSFDAVGELFSTEGSGIALRLDAVLEPYLASEGILDNRTDGLNASIEDIADRREALNDRLVALEERLFRQFNALDGLLAQLRSTSEFLTRQLATLPGSVPVNRDNN